MTLNGDHPPSAPHRNSVVVDLDGDHRTSDAQRRDVLASLNGGQLANDAHASDASDPLNGDRSRPDTHGAVVAVERDGGHDHAGAHPHRASVSWSYIKLCADSLDDFERTRIAAENRLRALSQRGLGDALEAKRAAELVEIARHGEKLATRDLEWAMKQHPLGEWIKNTVGVGLKQGARLLAEIGEPTFYVDGETGEVIPRTVSKLWAYCGYKPGQKRRKGEQANWNATAKMRARLIAESCIKQRHSPYRAVYDAEREKWAKRDTSDGHKHNHALRAVAKEVLKDIWRFSRGEAISPSVPTEGSPRLS